ncbi:hypothetical protein BCR32DRAFT_326355 [Anaeromyces robustus]|uniref:Uncharacterized protein n=1 Tax=Anaeromyces robustus TaxID=1754192 RepID=A0A1Y1XCS9_9FUNG|nr:hypothetical protein BCR32DRAFT_326355 [Anaeromyces robustus]|eukprot:ORX83549.1 hypothetical protein BCR32DRAFT_326355 [Anaeromyces robustus]
MGDFLEGIWQELIVAIIMLVLGYYYGKWKCAKDWNKKKFKDRVVLSLNTVTPVENNKYKLQIRTLMEKNLSDFIQNDQMEKIIKKAISNTKPGKPLLFFSQEDAWYILNSVLNQIVFQFADGIIKKDMGLKVNSQWYTFCLTFEKEEDLLMKKLRIMIIKRELLQNFPDDNSSFVLESYTHNIRIETLRTLKEELRKNPHCFMNVEIYQ